MLSAFASSSPILAGALASLCAGLATAIGALPILVIRKPFAQTQDVMLGFAAGVMLAASFFSLIIPGIDVAQEQGATKLGAVLLVIAGILFGAASLWLVHRYLPHEHFIMGQQGPEAPRFRRIWLFVIAITLHNFPEGLAVAVALLSLDYSKGQAFLVALLTGLVEPLGGLLGAGAVTVAQSLLPWGLAYAGGAMIFVISDEIIPETHRRGFENHCTVGLMIGLVVMMFLDVMLG